jgi:molybdopterin/thiamine biosynthesis adenylyltransferase/rhodanese-related sulfurtransferase
MNTDHRYSRHLALPGFTQVHQQRLFDSEVAIVGCGGLGTPVALYLAAAGVGSIKLIDHDTVSLSNLQRQVIYTEADIGQSKVAVMAKRLLERNSACKVEVCKEAINSANAMGILKDADVILDCCDNFSTRYLLCDVSLKLKIPVVYGAIHQFEGQVAVFNAKRDINYRDMHILPPNPGSVENCELGGVLGTLAGIIGSMQASEALKLLTEIGEILDGKLCYFDAISNRTHLFEITPNPNNYHRKENADKIELIDYDLFCGTEKTKLNNMNEISVQELKSMMDSQDDFQLIDVREPFEFDEINLGALLIPMNRIPDRVIEISRDKKVVVHCKAGSRSANVIQYLETQHGYTNLSNLRGGIMAWQQAFGNP